MEDILRYENRGQLYEVLINKFGLNIVEEKYTPQSFGNFFITLSAREFLLRYLNDRSYLSIQIAGRSDPSKWYDLSFVRDYIYDPENINKDESAKDNATRIKELNEFLLKSFDLVSDLFNAENYAGTRRKIDELLKRQFNRRFPGMIQ
jgi:hypothetical protein